jgi:hypothetical protein
MSEMKCLPDQILQLLLWKKSFAPLSVCILMMTIPSLQHREGISNRKVTMLWAVRFQFDDRPDSVGEKIAVIFRQTKQGICARARPLVRMMEISLAAIP